MRLSTARAIVEREEGCFAVKKSWVRQARDTTRWEGAARGNTTAASKGIKLHRWGGTHLLGGHITDYAHHLAGRSYRWPT